MRRIVIGVDVSKEKLDFCIQSEDSVLQEFITENTIYAIKSSLIKVLKKHQIQAEDVLLCAEHTGQYTSPLSCACNELSICLWLENPTRIKLSSGVQQGKSGRIDARTTAAYASQLQDKMRLFSLPEKNIVLLKQLISERDRHISDKDKCQEQTATRQQFMNKDDYAEKRKHLEQQIKDLELSIAEYLLTAWVRKWL